LTLPSISLAGVPSTIQENALISEITMPAIHGLFEANILPYIERIDSESAMAYLSRACRAFDVRWSGLNVTCNFELVNYGNHGDQLQRFGLGAVFYQEYGTSEELSASALDREIAAFDRGLARRIFVDIEKAIDYGSLVLMPRDLLGIGIDTWFLGDVREFFANIVDNSQRPGEPEPEVDFAEIRKVIRMQELLTPGKMRQLVGRHHYRATMPNENERDVLIAEAPRHLRYALQRIVTICAEAEGPRPDVPPAYLVDEGDTTNLAIPAVVIDTSQPSVGYEAVGTEAVRDFYDSAANSGIDFPPACIFPLRPGRKHMLAFAEHLAARDRAARAFIDLQSVILEFERKHDKRIR
jgi:hypothetical protein